MNGSVARDNGHYGIEILGGDRLSVQYSQVIGGDMGIVVRDGAARMQITGNQISDPGTSVLDVDQATGAYTATGNNTQAWHKTAGFWTWVKRALKPMNLIWASVLLLIVVSAYRSPDAGMRIGRRGAHPYEKQRKLEHRTVIPLRRIDPETTQSATQGAAGSAAHGGMPSPNGAPLPDGDPVGGVRREDGAAMTVRIDVKFVVGLLVGALLMAGSRSRWRGRTEVATSRPRRPRTARARRGTTGTRAARTTRATAATATATRRPSRDPRSPCPSRTARARSPARTKGGRIIGDVFDGSALGGGNGFGVNDTVGGNTIACDNKVIDGPLVKRGFCT